jgi:NADH:ubiquinone oxidoreductase subunit 3 (subunit A)
MHTRRLIAYALFALLLVAGIFAVRWLVQHSERNVRRRERRERRARYKAGLASREEAQGDESGTNE